MTARAPRLALALSLALFSVAAALPEAVAEGAQQKFALSVFHFNVQYVAGGMVGFTPQPSAEFDRDERAIEDQIIVESFEPLLDLFLAHPTWGADLEMQGYMLDVMAERHPQILEKLRTLAQKGQVDVPSFHYSDQLFLAYPREDWARSAALTRETFARHKVPLATTVFCQEGQAGPGMAAAMKEYGYKTLVWPKNLFSYQHGDARAPAPVYRFGEVAMITSQGGKWESGADSVDVAWTFVNDGELLATGDVNPYFPGQFKKSAPAVAEYEAGLAKLSAAGYQITTVAKYMEAIATVVPKADAPPLLDGTWQPGTTDGVLRWLGGRGLWPEERDNDVRTLGALAHRELIAAETIARVSGIEAGQEIAGGFRLLALGQVSDATGINPFRGEVEYGLAHFAEVLRIAREVIVRGRTALGAKVVAIDTRFGMVLPDPPAPAAATETTAPIALEVSAEGRSVAERWTRVSDGNYRVELRFGAGEERAISVGFPGAMGDIVYTPGLAEAPVHVPRGAFQFSRFQLALTDGLIGLGGGRYAIKDQARVHLAARIERAVGDVLFLDETTPPGEATVWVFHLVEGSEADAAAVARGLNVTPTVWR
ncbi:MAG: hypothetical protein EXR72_18165 [Myxococcales bacterium]|nr:hypothetical protein [Myxococcales bacterium]